MFVHLSFQEALTVQDVLKRPAGFWDAQSPMQIAKRLNSPFFGHVFALGGRILAEKLACPLVPPEGHSLAETCGGECSSKSIYSLLSFLTETLPFID